MLSLTRKQQWLIVALIPVAGLAWLLPGRLDVVVSGSLSHRIFLLVSVPEKIQLGDYLLFKYQNGHRYVDLYIRKSLTSHDILTKQVGCAPGNVLKVDEDRSFTCNGQPLGQALQTDTNGDVLPLFVFNGVIPQDNYFMVGSNARSYDSRYFGFIRKDEIAYKAYPLW